MSNTNNYVGVSTPKFHMMKYQDQYAIISIEMDCRYCFKIDDQWISVDISEVDKYIQDIDPEIINDLKKRIQMADKLAIQLLIIHRMAFTVVPGLFELIVKSINQSITLTTTQEIKFFPITTYGIKNSQSLSEKIWKLIYINKILKSAKLPVIITNWLIVISSYRYIFNNDSTFDTSSRLLQLRNMIAQINNTNSTNEIKTLCSKLIDSIDHSNLNLPDICISFQYPRLQLIQDKSNRIQLAKDILKLIANLAHRGIINNDTDIDNIRFDPDLNQINFYNYENAILSHEHTDAFKYSMIDIATIVNATYDKPDAQISSDQYHVFNCYVMYDVIRSLVSINSNNEDIDKIIIDANSILEQIYDTNPVFLHKKRSCSSIEWLYEKHFGSLQYIDTFAIYKSSDEDKLEYLTNYIHHFDLNNNM